MSLRTSVRSGVIVAAISSSLFGALAIPAVASAAPATEYTTDHVDWRGGHRYWDHPEWGRGWNRGYPAPGWIPPRGWYPPADWAPPSGWYPPAGWAPPGDWVGPCSGPLFDLFHPVRCFRI